jgi:hypothetical protein
MALNISIRSGQFGDDQLTSDHFSSTTQYASFLVDSSLTNGNAAVANIADLNALEATIETAIDSDLDARLGSLATVLGAGITYDTANDTFTFGTINLTSSAAPVAPAILTDWTSVIEAIDTALKTAETGISTNAGNIATNTSNIATNTAGIGTNAGDITTLRGDVNATLGLNVANPSGIAGFAGTNYLTAATITSVFGAIEGLDSALDTIEQALISADQGLQANIDTLESNVENRLGITNITSATAFNLGSSTYLQSATDVSNALSLLDAAIVSNDGDIAANLASIGTNATDITNLDLRLTTAEGDISTNATNIGGLQTELDATQTSLGFINTAYSNSGTYISGSTVTADISALDTAVQANATSISNLGSAFEYVGTVSGGANNTSATDLSTTLTQKEAGDYYKVASAGYFSDGVNTFYANQNDGLVWNNASPNNTIDIIDNTNANIQDSGNIVVSGSADSGWTVDSSVIDGKVATNEGDIAQLNTDLTALEGRVTTNEGDITQNATDIGTNAGNIATNTSDIATNTSDIGDINTEMDSIETAVGLENDGTKTDFDSTGSGSTHIITKTGSFKDAIQELDAALEQSSTAPVDTGRLTVAPMSHQYADFARLDDANDLQAYASEVYDADATNTSGTNGGGFGDLHEFRIPTVAGNNQILVLGSLLANAPNPTNPANSGNSSHLNNNTYWSSVRVYKNGVRLIQRNSSATLQSADEYKVVAVVNPVNYPATYGDYDTSDEFVRYPIKYGSKVESAWRAQVLSLTIGQTDTNAGDSHNLAGQTNTDVTPTTAHPLANTVHPNAGLIRYYKVEFGGVLNTQDIITVDYMGLKD